MNTHLVLNTTPHDPTDACEQVHCHIHHIDEWAAKPYRICFECGHLYAGKRALRRAYR